MTLLEFARGPGLYWATIIFVLGIVWRLAGALLLPRLKDYSTARDKANFKNGIRTIITRSAPAHELEKNIKFQHYTGYIWHIGLFIVPRFGFLGGVFLNLGRTCFSAPDPSDHGILNARKLLFGDLSVELGAEEVHHG